MSAQPERGSSWSAPDDFSNFELPDSLCSVEEIARLRDPQDRAVEMVKLLEALLRHITPVPEEVGYTLEDLLRANAKKFADFAAIDSMRRVRNRLVHVQLNQRPPSPSKIAEAETTARAAVFAALSGCSSELRRAVCGDPRLKDPSSTEKLSSAQRRAQAFANHQQQMSKAEKPRPAPGPPGPVSVPLWMQERAQAQSRAAEPVSKPRVATPDSRGFIESVRDVADFLWAFTFAPVGHGILSMLFLGPVGCTVTYFRNVRTPEGVESLEPFAGGLTTPLWLYSFSVGVVLSWIFAIKRYTRNK